MTLDADPLGALTTALDRLATAPIATHADVVDGVLTAVVAELDALDRVRDRS